MRLRFVPLAMAVVLAFGFWQSVSAQSVFSPNPNAGSPYGRPALSPYLNIVPGPVSGYYFGTLREYDIRAQLIRPIVLVSPDAFSGYDPSRSPYQAVSGYQNAEEWVNQRIRETQLSPTGHPSGFLIANPYYRLPNQRSFAPYNPGTGVQPR
jgi:hypothetical protein